MQDTLVLVETSNSIVNKNMIIVEATPQVQNAKDSSIEREKEDVNVADGSTLEEVWILISFGYFLLPLILQKLIVVSIYYKMCHQ